MENTLTVANMEQKIIFITEMQGQISDGMWENARPDGHWKPWCRLDNDSIFVGPDIGTTGRFAADNGYSEKRNYNFASSSLLEIVGQRIITKINLWKMLGDKVLQSLLKGGSRIPDDVEDFDYALKNMNNNNNNYWAKLVRAWQELGITREDVEKAEKGPYTMKDLRKDCSELKKALKTAKSASASKSQTPAKQPAKEPGNYEQLDLFTESIDLSFKHFLKIRNCNKKRETI